MTPPSGDGQRAGKQPTHKLSYFTPSFSNGWGSGNWRSLGVWRVMVDSGYFADTHVGAVDPTPFSVAEAVRRPGCQTRNVAWTPCSGSLTWRAVVDSAETPVVPCAAF